ncbi:MAG: glycosyltransferase family 4 protein [Tatlockia sp.]|nr:glycosyltransferase family 4 protein [Tatlockia sp.]
MVKALKKIAIDLTPILPGGENGGAKLFVLELIGQLAKLAPETEFILLTQAASHEELQGLESKNIRCLKVLDQTLKKAPFFNLLISTLRKLPIIGRKLAALGYRLNTLFKRRQAHSLLQELKADLLFCPFTAPTYSEPGIPTVCTIYDLQYKTYPEFFKAEELIHRDQTFIEACRRASMLTAISDYSRLSAIKHAELKPEKIRTIHLQMARRIMPDSKQDVEILKTLNLTSQQYLIYPANFWKHKNHEMLLTAFGIACQNGLPATMKLVCTGAEGARQRFLAEAAAQMGLGERILFPGYLSNSDLTLLISNSLAVFFPSLYEGFGLPIIEAMAASVPVACSDLCSLPEVAGKAALLFNPRIPTQIADVILSISTNSELRAKLIKAGNERAKLFSDSSKMAKDYWMLFEQVLGLESNEKRAIDSQSIELISEKESA